MPHWCSVIGPTGCRHQRIALDQLGLEPALLALVERVKLRGLDIDAHVELSHEPAGPGRRLVPALETGIYRIVQEALTNALKHGRATATVEVLEDEDQVTVTVRVRRRKRRRSSARSTTATGGLPQAGAGGVLMACGIGPRSVPAGPTS
jgi:signal transduction histidine kinase